MDLATEFNPSWITAITVAAAGIAWVLKTLKEMRNGNSGSSNVELTKEMAKNITALSFTAESNSKLLEELVDLHRESQKVLLEIERRGRGTEDAVRKVSDLWETSRTRRK